MKPSQPHHLKQPPAIPLPQNPNERIAPWYGVHTLEEQHHAKLHDLKSYLEKLGKPHTLQSILHTPPYTAYRNSNKFTFGYDQGALGKSSDDPTLPQHLRLGFIGGKYPTNHILPYSQAITINQTFKQIASLVEHIVQQTNLKAFAAPPRIKKRRTKQPHAPYSKHQGIWKYLTIRHSLTQDRYMVCLVNFVRHLSPEQEKTYNQTLHNIQKALEKLPKVSIFTVQPYSKTLEPQPSDPIHIHLDRSPHQKGALCETLRGHQFLISPTSFFQVNTTAAEQLYNQIHTLIHEQIKSHTPHRKNVLLDLYCGTGSIGLTLAQHFDQVIGIDEVQSSIDNATINAHLNNISNATYWVARCEESLPLLQTHLNNQPLNLYIIVNPARDGLHKKVRKFIKTTPHTALIYSSCNVQTWTRDIADLTTPDNPSTEQLTLHKTFLVDLFPHTKHYEVLSYLQKNNN